MHKQLGCWLRSSHHYKNAKQLTSRVALRRKCTGAKHTTEAAEYSNAILVGERSMQEEDRS